MEKRIWSKPEMNEFAFAANEYVAACGDQNSIYKFICDAGSKWKKYFVYVDVGHDGDTSNDKGWLTSVADWIDNMFEGREGHNTTYSPCGTTHEASTQDDFLYGYMYEAGYDRRKGYYNSGERIDVVIWGESDNQDTHCTTDLDIDSWETEKS